jgi:hypothetical protein
VSHINDLEWAALNLLGFGENIDEMELAWLQAKAGVTADQLNDAWMEFLNTQVVPGQLQDMQRDWLINIVGIPEGHLNDMLKQYWALVLLNEALDPVAALDHTSITDTAGAVTSWKNKAAGASAGGGTYDLNVVGGDPQVGVEQAKRVVDFDGAGDFLRSAVQQTVAQVCTVVAVARSDQDATGGTRRLLDGRDTTVAAKLVLTAADVWQANAGVQLNLPSVDTDLHIHLCEFDGVNTEYVVVSNPNESVIGNAGADPLQYITLGAHAALANFWDGSVGGLWVFSRALTALEKKLAVDALKTLWVIP